MRLSKKEVGALAGFAAFGGLLYYFREDVGAMVAGAGFFKTLKDIFGRGKLLTHAVYDKELGLVLTEPSVLNLQASSVYGYPIDNDTMAAARMIRSEGAAQGSVRLHVALNDLEQFQFANNLFELLTYSTDPKRKGFYGDQWSPAVPSRGYPHVNARRYSTNRDPYEIDVFVAQDEIKNRRLLGIDKAKGATRFIDKSAMGKQSGTVSFEMKDAEWKKDGFVAFQLPEYGSDLVLYRRV